MLKDGLFALHFLFVSFSHQELFFLHVGDLSLQRSQLSVFLFEPFRQRFVLINACFKFFLGLAVDLLTCMVRSLVLSDCFVSLLLELAVGFLKSRVFLMLLLELESESFLISL